MRPEGNWPFPVPISAVPARFPRRGPLCCMKKAAVNTRRSASFVNPQFLAGPVAVVIRPAAHPGAFLIRRRGDAEIDKRRAWRPPFG